MKALTIIISTIFTSIAYAVECDDVEKLIWIESANARQDATKALKNGDTRFMATYGFAYIIPGVSDAEVTQALKTKNFIAIEGTSDDLCSDRHSGLNQQAINYASEYNQRIKQGLSLNDH